MASPGSAPSCFQRARVVRAWAEVQLWSAWILPVLKNHAAVTSRYCGRERDRTVGVSPVPWLACGARPGAQHRLAPGFVLAGQGAQRPARVRAAPGRPLFRPRAQRRPGGLARPGHAGVPRGFAGQALAVWWLLCDGRPSGEAIKGLSIAAALFKSAHQLDCVAD